MDLHELLMRLGTLTGIPVLLNTSLNFPCKPIVESPADALELFQARPIDALLLGGSIHRKFSPWHEPATLPNATTGAFITQDGLCFCRAIRRFRNSRHSCRSCGNIAMHTDDAFLGQDAAPEAIALVAVRNLAGVPTSIVALSGPACRKARPRIAVGTSRPTMELE